jgi:ferredoxin, 2Fe-2S
MPRIIVTTRDGVESKVEGELGLSVMEAIRHAGIDELAAICGGSCSCATCHIYIHADFVERLPAMSSEENELLDCSDRRTDLSRLACQLPVSDVPDGLKVVIAPEDK